MLTQTHQTSFSPHFCLLFFSDFQVWGALALRVLLPTLVLAGSAGAALLPLVFTLPFY